MTPPEFVGNIMPMCQDRRGDFKDMQYLTPYWSSCTTKCRSTRLFMIFFDALKANTKGYASA